MQGINPWTGLVPLFLGKNMPDVDDYRMEIDAWKERQRRKWKRFLGILFFFLPKQKTPARRE